MRIRFIVGMLSLAICCKYGAAQEVVPEIREARTTVLAFCQAFLDGDSDAALAQLDLSGEGNEDFARLLPMLCEMTHAEAQLYETVDVHFGEESEKAYRSPVSLTSMPNEILENIDELSIVLEEGMALLQAPGPDDEPIDLFVMNKVDDEWKIDPATSLGFAPPQTEEEWEMWRNESDSFVGLMTELREEVPSMDSTDQYNQRYVERIEAMQGEAENDAE